MAVLEGTELNDGGYITRLFPMAPSPTPLRVINVLIVDDSASCRLMTKRSFQITTKEGCKICCDQASNGRQAVEMISSILHVDFDASLHSSAYSKVGSPIKGQQQKRKSINSVTIDGEYDLILMDYQMPHMDGPTAIRRIRELGYQGQIVGLTGNVLGTEIETMRQAGANKVLSKPVQLTDIESLIMEL